MNVVSSIVDGSLAVLGIIAGLMLSAFAFAAAGSMTGRVVPIRKGERTSLKKAA